MGDGAESLPEVQVIKIHCSAIMPEASHFVRLIRHDFPFINPC